MGVCMALVRAGALKNFMGAVVIGVVVVVIVNERARGGSPTGVVPGQRPKHAKGGAEPRECLGLGLGLSCSALAMTSLRVSSG